MNGQQLSERELALVRLRFIDLLKSFFEKEPDAEMLGRWRGIFTALSRQRINPRLDEAIRAINELLSNMQLTEIQDEYYALFTDPYSKHLLPQTGSRILDGKNFGPSLAAYRELLKKANLIKKKGVDEPEDSFLLMLDSLATLIELQRRGDPDAAAHQQALIQEFLVPAAAGLAGAVARNERAVFYRRCIDFFTGYLELERGIN